MKKINWKWISFFGIVCIFMTMASVWYAVVYQESRIVAPMDYSNYVFQVGDFPMWISIIGIVLYVIFLIAILILWSIEKKNSMKYKNKMIKTNGKWGFLGIMGFLGFLGFRTYSIDGSIFPFLFFSFFGFFGLFFQSKMSDVLMDERFQENVLKAQSNANRIGISIIWLSMLVLTGGKFIKDLNVILIALVILFH